MEKSSLQKAKDKYLAEKVETIAIRVPKGEKAVLQAHAAEMGESLNAFVKRALQNQIKADKK